ncbi:hypothetical protein B0T11DRAFT_318921 [Plectosphaerella cucumerina]|uniref:Uncharacterized protein n=1 Tax=Plectosphaerella cucumerina TaxID=40658 RepID=A0A8K0TGG1_9PEZI|nr:hypothetical protein B0T11DRAFT_318921 [Plectosphaerella cucumerina]
MAHEFNLEAQLWSGFDLPHFSDTSCPDTSDTTMQQASDGLLLQPLLGSSPPAVGAEFYDAWDWAGDRQDYQAEGFLPEALPDDNLDSTQRQALSKAAPTDGGGEVDSATREVLDYVHQDAQSPERTSQALINMEERFHQRLANMEERFRQRLADSEEQVHQKLANFTETLAQLQTRVEATHREIAEDKKRICQEAEESTHRLEAWMGDLETYTEEVRGMVTRIAET